MDSSDLEKLLEPLSDESPCGPDLEYDSEFGEMERAAQGKGEQQFGDTIVAAEPPDWKDVKRRVQSLLERTKDMRVAVYLARCSLHMDGLPGFRFALELLRGYVETYWDSVHPELDHSDNDDPTYRTNTLITLCDEDTILRELRDAPIVSSRAMGQFSIRDLENAKDATDRPAEKPSEGAWAEDESAPAPERPGPTLAAIDAAFSDAAVEDVQATEEATRLSAEHIAAIEQFVTEQVGVGNAVSLLPVQNILEEINKVLVSQLERRGVYAETPESEGGDASASDTAESTGQAGGVEAAAAFQLSGRINSRDEAIKVLDKVCEFYERNEPSSPLPLLIRRAQRLASKSFLDIIRDLAPDAVTQAEALGGAGAAGYAEHSGDETAEAASEKSSNW
jgi:type VI secretion system protein ImpA